ncbi:MAG: potassium transporter [Rickettsiales bacterium]|nr:potassium transporter [Rickettsiales bacterium]
MVVAILQKIANSDLFNNFIIGIIIAAGVVVGIQTYPELRNDPTLSLLDSIILWIFVAEVLIKMGSQGSRPWRYFLDPWNVFDFIIVAVCFLPGETSFAAVLRLARLLRVLKLVRALPRLQVLVSALLKSIPSMFYISLLLSLLFYLYGVLGTFLYQENDPVHFEDLQTGLLTMYRVSTLEDWTDVMYINMFGCHEYGYDSSARVPCNEAAAKALVGEDGIAWSAAFFFSSFTLLATMIILNLFIGVIMTGMEEAQKELKGFDGSTSHKDDPRAQLQTLSAQLETLAAELKSVKIPPDDGHAVAGDD